jgi:hypothetical protein
MSRTSIYVHSCIVCFNVFLKVGVYGISYTCFQKINVIKIKWVAIIIYVKQRKSWFFAKSQWIVYYWGLDMFYTETVNSFFHLYGCGYHYNRIDATPLVASTPEKMDDDSEALYLGYYDWSLTRQLWCVGPCVSTLCTFCIWLVTCVSLILLYKTFFCYMM